jgi:hypothetical protein
MDESRADYSGNLSVGAAVIVSLLLPFLGI